MKVAGGGRLGEPADGGVDPGGQPQMPRGMVRYGVCGIRRGPDAVIRARIA